MNPRERIVNMTRRDYTMLFLGGFFGALSMLSLFYLFTTTL